ncbi:MAG: alkyl hydroperoxide reductase [Myxococcota bacterium]
MLLDPYGRVVVNSTGAPSYDALERAVDDLVCLFDCEINRAALPEIKPETHDTGGLAFPLKVLATGERLFVADTGNHRLVICDHQGKVQQQIGCGEAGLRDGDASNAAFNEPAGMCLVGDLLYIADVENHAIRRVDLETGQVTTVAGTGERGFRLDSGKATDVALSSPWALAQHGARLFVAMAGNHTIWSLALDGDQIELHAGNGMERLVDGPLKQVSFNQPSDLAILGGKLYVADSEVSGIRAVDLDPTGRVETVVGTGLFDYGDIDGVGEEVRLQHVLAVHAHDGVLLLADAYNHKIKRLDPASGRCETLCGDGTAGRDDGASPRFYEPSGLSVAAGKLFVADQNNHAVRVVDLDTGSAATLDIRGL